MDEEFCDNASIYVLIEAIIRSYLQNIFIIVQIITILSSRKRKRDRIAQPYSMIDRIPSQVHHLNRVTGVYNTDCISNLRMDRNAFGRLCLILRQRGGLEDGKYVTVEEQVASFLAVLAHHKKNRIIGFDYWRSGQTVSFYLHKVLKAVLLLHRIFLVNPEPVDADCNDPRWKWFEVM